jgi:recombination protein RecA
VRLDIRRIGAIKKGEEVVGNETRVKVVKNKVAPPFAKRCSTFSTAKAFRASEIVSSASITRSSKNRARGTYKGEDQPGQDNAREFLREHRDRAGSRTRSAVDVPTPGRNPSAAMADE